MKALSFWKALLPFSMRLHMLVMQFHMRAFRFRRFLTVRLAPFVFKPRPDDIFVATYPKSGTTLVQMILYQLKTSGEMNFPHINTVSPYLELDLVRQNIKFLDDLESPRCFKTHWLAHELPLHTGRYIYIVRDVRDVVVSAYHHEMLAVGMGQSLEQFTQRFLSSRWMGFPTWFEHLESWWPHRKDPSVLFLSFEEIIADLEGTVRQVARFCQIDFREEDMPRILERCSFAFMKQHDQKFDPRFQIPTQGFIRKGQAGSGRELAPRHVKALEEKLTAVARKLGCERGEPYREIVSGGWSEPA